MMYLDLSELDMVFHGRLLWSTRRAAIVRFDRKDYLGNKQESLDKSVRDIVEKEKEVRPLGPIRMLTNLRYFGFAMILFQSTTALMKTGKHWRILSRKSVILLGIKSIFMF